MAQPVAVVGDMGSHGLAALVDTAPTVIVAGKTIATFGPGGPVAGAIPPCGLYQPPPSPVHPEGIIVPGPAGGSATVFAGGLPVHRGGDSRGCGAVTISSVPNVFCG